MQRAQEKKEEGKESHKTPVSLLEGEWRQPGRAVCQLALKAWAVVPICILDSLFSPALYFPLGVAASFILWLILISFFSPLHLLCPVLPPRSLSVAMFSSYLLSSDTSPPIYGFDVTPALSLFSPVLIGLLAPPPPPSPSLVSAWGFIRVFLDSAHFSNEIPLLDQSERSQRRASLLSYLCSASHPVPTTGLCAATRHASCSSCVRNRTANCGPLIKCTGGPLASVCSTPFSPSLLLEVHVPSVLLYRCVFLFFHFYLCTRKHLKLEALGLLQSVHLLRLVFLFQMLNDAQSIINRVTPVIVCARSTLRSGGFIPSPALTSEGRWDFLTCCPQTSNSK